VAAVGFLVAFYFLYDPYYYPTLRRYSDDGRLTELMLLLGAGALVSTATTLWRPRAGMLFGAVVLVACVSLGPLGADGH
jgi:hypothetical protein